MAAFTKIPDFIENAFEGVFNFSSDATCTITVALSNTAPASEGTNPLTDGNGVLANVTQIAYTNLSARVVAVSSSSQTGGTYKLVLTDLTLTASGTVADFRYVYLYDDDPTSPADPLIAYWDYGSTVSLSDTETFKLDFDPTNGVLQAA